MRRFAEMLRDARLGDPEFGLNDGADGAGGQLAVVGEQFEDSASHGVAEDIERVHGLVESISSYLYKSSVIGLETGCR